MITLPIVVRRWVVAPLWFGVSIVVVVAAAPLVALASLVLPIAPRRLRPLLRLFVTSIGYLAVFECGMLLGCFVLWVYSQFVPSLQAPRFRALHLSLQRSVTRATVALSVWLSRTTLVVHQAPDAVGESVLGDGPVLVLAQHAGAFNFVFVPYVVQQHIGRDITCIGVGTLALDPAIDVMMDRLSFRTISKGDSAAWETIEEWIRQTPRDRIRLLFPEGASFTARRREAILRRLRGRRLPERMRIAAELERVLPPSAAGVRMALAACPGTHVIFIAHTGMVPFPSGVSHDVIRAECWRVPASSVPVDAASQGDWLYGWWRVIDQWQEPQPQLAITPQAKERRCSHEPR